MSASTGKPRCCRPLLGGVLIAVALLAGCASLETRSGPASTPEAAIVRNSIQIGLIETTFFVVDSVDGRKVHEKLDFKRQVEIPAGRRELEVTYYTDALWGSRDASETCKIVVDVEAGGIYELQGEAERGEWRARLVRRGTSNEVACVFADEVGVATGEADDAGLAAPVAPPPVAQTGSPEAGSVPVENGVAAEGEGGSAKLAMSEALEESPRRRSFCPRRFYRVSHFDGDTTFVLERTDRVRLIGVEANPDAPPVPDGDGLRIEGKCVRFEYEPTYLIDGHRDRDGRLLAYVYLEDGTFVNEELIREGRLRPTTERHRHLAAFLAAQAEARERQGMARRSDDR